MLDKNCIQLIEDTTRQSSVELMGLVDYLDLLIPRGGAGLIKAVVENAKVPVIETGVGNCHVFVDESADIDMAANIIYNAKLLAHLFAMRLKLFSYIRISQKKPCL